MFTLRIRLILFGLLIIFLKNFLIKMHSSAVGCTIKEQITWIPPMRSKHWNNTIAQIREQLTIPTNTERGGGDEKL